jgi:hypothetical protein
MKGEECMNKATSLSNQKKDVLGALKLQRGQYREALQIFDSLL